MLGEEGISVSHAPQLGLWVVRGGYGVRFSVSNTTEWGTDRRSALELIEDGLNLRIPTIYDHDADTDRDVINAPATEAARDQQEKEEGVLEVRHGARLERPLSAPAYAGVAPSALRFFRSQYQATHTQIS